MWNIKHLSIPMQWILSEGSLLNLRRDTVPYTTWSTKKQI